MERAQNTFKFRNFDGYYVQGQVKTRKFDVSAGWGITRMFLLDEDVIPNATTGEPVNSLPMQQMGVSGGVFYHHTDYLDLRRRLLPRRHQVVARRAADAEHVQPRHDPAVLELATGS